MNTPEWIASICGAVAGLALARWRWVELRKILLLREADAWSRDCLGKKVVVRHSPSGRVGLELGMAVVTTSGWRQYFSAPRLMRHVTFDAGMAAEACRAFEQCDQIKIALIHFTSRYRLVPAQECVRALDSERAEFLHAMQMESEDSE